MSDDIQRQLFADGYAYVPTWLIQGGPASGWSQEYFDRRRTDPGTGVEWFEFTFMTANGDYDKMWVPSVLLFSEYPYY